MDSQQLLQMLMLGGGGGGGGIVPGQVGAPGVDINSILRQVLQRRPEEIGYQGQITKPSSLSMPFNRGMDMGATNFGGLPYARSGMANTLGGVGAMMGNMREAMQVERERAKQRRIQERLMALVERSLGDLENETLSQQLKDSANDAPLLDESTMFDDEQPRGQRERRARTA